MKIKRIFLTGGSGFIGSHISTVLLKKGYHVYLFKGDVRKKKQVIDEIQVFKPDVVYHLGAIVDLSRSYSVAIKCIDINIKGTLNVLEAVRGLSLKKFIYTSTEEVYGQNYLPYSEDYLPQPPSPYAVTKIAAEQLIRQYAKELGFDSVVFRIGTVYGPGQQKATRLIPIIIDKAIKGDDIPLNSGLKKRDYIYIDDVAEALTRVLRIKNLSAHEIINLGGGRQYSLKEMVNVILDVTKSTSKPAYNTFPDRLHEADEWMLDISKAEKVMNWKPSTSLREGIKKTVRLHKKNVEV